MRKKRHSLQEITAKLRQAEDLAVQGKRQSDIARALGVSVMTLHRWRKMSHLAGLATAKSLDATMAFPQSRSLMKNGDLNPNIISEQRLENSRLRRLVADLMLEKMKLEEMVQFNKLAQQKSHR